MNTTAFLIMLAIFLPISNINGIITYAHNFSTDDNSSFLTLINMLVIENRLLNDSISDINNNNDSRYIEHIENTENILEDILISEDSFTVNSDQFYNNTVIALVVANLADEVLRNYGYAFGVPSNIMLSMNFSNIINSQNKSNDIANANSQNNHITHQENSPSTAATAGAPMIDMRSYITTLELTDRMIQLYSNELNGTSSESIYINKAKLDLGSAVYGLKKSVESKESPYKIMEIVHGNVHPNLQLAFNLTIKR